MSTQKEDLLDEETKDTPAADSSEATGLEAVAPTASEMDALRRECSDLRDQLLRRRADFENFRKRAERDREMLAQEARAQILTGLLNTADNLEKALAAPGDGDPTLREGVQLTYRNLLAFLESEGVVAKDPTGEKFDPQQHQALLYEPVPDVADDTVVETFRKAYFLKDRLLRPALVKVAKGTNG
jgi:molecular chaperone GrpE